MRLLCLAVIAVPLFADVFQDIRGNSISALQSADVNLRDKNGVTPLLYASALGSIEAMQLLLSKGADPNAADNAGSTPLLWAACQPDRVKLLLAKGANPNAKTKAGRTPLMAASACESGVDSIRQLLAKGADVNAVSEDKNSAILEAAFSGGPLAIRALLAAGANPNATDGGGFTVLMGAVGWTDLELVKMLIAKGANVNAASVFAGKVVHGDIQLKQLTPLMSAVPFGSPEMVKALLDAGADVNAKDCRGMNALAFAVSSARQDPRVVKLLLAKGADVNAASTANETPLDWARKFGARDVIALLEKAGSKGSPIPAAPVRATPPLAPHAAAGKSVSLLQTNADSFFAKSNCVACHHQPMAALAVDAARKARLPFDEKRFDLMKRTMVALLAPRPSGVLGMEVGPAGFDGLSNTTLALAAAGQAPGLLTDSAAVYLANRQTSSGAWDESMGIARTPMSDSQVTKTVYALRAMQLFAFPSRQAEFDQRVAKARHWLLIAKPRTAYEHAERLLGLAWAGAPVADLQRAAAALAKLQHADGSWSQFAGMPGDAYATSLALRALKESKQNTPANAKASAWLLKTQMDDGSWYVRSRAVKLQPYFDAGFPYEHDQWISYVATANATVALLLE